MSDNHAKTIIIILLLIFSASLIVVGIMVNDKETPIEEIEKPIVIPISNETAPKVIPDCIDADGNEITESYNTKCHPLPIVK
jgi:hypothetical protein